MKKSLMRRASILMAAIVVMTTFAMPASAATPNSTKSYGYKVTTARTAYRNLDDDDIVFVSPSSTVLKTNEKVTYKPSSRQDDTYRMSETWTAKYVEDLYDYSDSRKVLIPTGSYSSALRAGNKIKINYKLIAVKSTSAQQVEDGTGDDDYLFDEDEIYLDMR